MKIRRAAADRRQSQAAPNDLAVVQRAGRIAAMQASSALAAVLLLVGAVVFTVDMRVQNHRINAELDTVAASADDVNDPPPGMELVLRDNNGRVSASDGGLPGVELLSGPAGFVDVHEAKRVVDTV